MCVPLFCMSCRTMSEFDNNKQLANNYDDDERELRYGGLAVVVCDSQPVTGHHPDVVFKVRVRGMLIDESGLLQQEKDRSHHTSHTIC